MAMIRLIILLTLFSCEATNSETKSISTNENKGFNQRIKLQISSRVDTSNVDIKEVLNLYENYINSNPDSIYNNPYWNDKEKEKYNDFDFSRMSIYFGISSTQLFRIYDPFVLSVEPINDKYQIRILYSNTANEPPYVGSKVWCIHMLNVIKENRNWKLENLIGEETKNWNKKRIDFIEYVYPNEYLFDEKKAKKAISFCNSIIERFNQGFDSQFRFYIANGIDEMGKLENFDYYFTTITTGKAREGMILSSKKDEFYPHEFIHKLLPENENRGPVIEEGVATFLGTKEDLSKYLSVMKKLANDYNNVETYSLKNVLNNQTKWNSYPVAYPGGALICEVIHEKKGDEGINKLIRGKTNNYDEIMELTMNILNVDKNELIRSIEKKIREYQ
jgi:hypothetical protein